MQIRSDTFNTTLDNIPVLNLRNEFARYYHSIKNKSLISQLNKFEKPIHTPYMIWKGMDDDLVSIICQRVILGIESYLSSAVYFELLLKGQLKEKINIIRNPFELKGRGTVDNFYHKLPALIDERNSLKSCDKELYEKVKIFYKEIRNPLFHGYNISGNLVSGIQSIFDFLAKIYAWIDGWHDIKKLFQ